MLGTLSLIHCLKLLQSFSKHSRDQKVSAHNGSFLTIIKSHGCKKILFSIFHAKKIADAVLLYVFIIGFPTSLWRKYGSKFNLTDTSVPRRHAVKIRFFFFLNLFYTGLNLSIISYTCLHTSIERLRKFMLKENAFNKPTN